MDKLVKVLSDELEQLILDAGADVQILDFEAAAELLLRQVRARVFELDQTRSGLYRDLHDHVNPIDARQIVFNVLES